jgi:hypothetical protein
LAKEKASEAFSSFFKLCSKGISLFQTLSSKSTKEPEGPLPEVLKSLAKFFSFNKIKFISFKIIKLK